MRTIKSAEIRHLGNGRFTLLLDGEEFPYHMARNDVYVETLIHAPSRQMHILELHLYVEGPITGVLEFNDKLADEADASRVRYADRRDLMLNYGLSYGVY